MTLPPFTTEDDVGHICSLLGILPQSYQGALDRYARVLVLPTPRAYTEHRKSSKIYEASLPHRADILKLTWIQVVNYALETIETQSSTNPGAQLEDIARKSYRCVTRICPTPQTFRYLELGFYELRARLAQLELQGQLRLAHFTYTQAFTIGHPHIFLGQYR